MVNKNSSKKETMKDLLNKIAGWLVIFSGVLLIYYNLLDFSNSLEILGWFSPVRSIIGAIGLIFLGIYILRFEKWAVVLSGVFGISLLISSRIFGSSGLFSQGLLFFVLSITPYVLIINWVFYRKK